MTKAENCSESICSRTKMSILTKKFHGMPFLLQWKSLCISGAMHLNLFCLNLYRLPLSLGFYQGSFDAKARAGGNQFHDLLRKLSHFSNYLYIVNDAAIVDGNEGNVFVATFSSY